MHLVTNLTKGCLYQKFRKLVKLDSFLSIIILLQTSQHQAAYVTGYLVQVGVRVPLLHVMA